MTSERDARLRYRARVATLERLALELRDYGFASRLRDTRPTPSLVLFRGGVEVVAIGLLGRQFHITTPDAPSPTLVAGAMHPVADPGGCARRVATRLRHEAEKAREEEG